MITLTMAYKRIGTTFTGSVVTDGAESAGLFFSDTPYADMFKNLATFAKEHNADKVVLQRTDKDGIKPYELSDSLKQCLLEDTAKFISMTSPVHRVYNLKEAPLGDVVYHTLAKSLGDLIYVRVRGCNAECPCCGNWVAILNGSVACTCSFNSKVVELSGLWAGFSTKELLARPETKFFLPGKAWSSGCWVEKQKLSELYTKFEQEKENAGT
jgi:hypothetical protein